MIVRELRQNQVILVCSESDCKKNGCKKVCERLKDEIQEQGLKGTVRIQRTKCMGRCGKGPNVMVCPNGTMYSAVKKKDVKEIVSACAANAAIPEAIPA